MPTTAKVTGDTLTKTKINMVETVEAPKLVTVQLIGSPNELLGRHSMSHRNFHVMFKNGVAKVSSVTAKELRKLGMVK